MENLLAMHDIQEAEAQKIREDEDFVESNQ